MGRIQCMDWSLTYPGKVVKPRSNGRAGEIEGHAFGHGANPQERASAPGQQDQPRETSSEHLSDRGPEVPSGNRPAARGRPTCGRCLAQVPPTLHHGADPVANKALQAHLRRKYE